MQYAKAFRSILIIGLLLMAFVAALLGIVAEPLRSSRPLFADLKDQKDITQALAKLSRDERESLSRREGLLYVANPLSITALQNLVVLRYQDNRTSDAEAIALAMAGFSRRSIASQLTAIQIDLAAKRYESAHSRLDGVLRARPDLQKQLFPILFQQLLALESQKQLAGLLAKAPPWRRAFFNESLVADPTGGIAYRVLKSIRQGGGQISDEERRMLINQLRHINRLDQAYFVWLDLLPQADLVLVRNVFDGGFTREPTNMFFDWSTRSLQGAEIVVSARAGKPTDRVLKLDFLNDKSGGPYVYQYTRLQPGAYELSFDVQVESIKNETGLIWRVVCIEKGQVLGQSSPIRDKGPWETRKFPFTVPTDSCATQMLYLTNRSTAALDQEISGRLAFDNIVIADAAGSQGNVEQN